MTSRRPSAVLVGEVSGGWNDTPERKSVLVHGCECGRSTAALGAPFTMQRGAAGTVMYVWKKDEIYGEINGDGRDG